MKLAPVFQDTTKVHQPTFFVSLSLGVIRGGTYLRSQDLTAQTGSKLFNVNNQAVITDQCHLFTPKRSRVHFAHAHRFWYSGWREMLRNPGSCNSPRIWDFTIRNPYQGWRPECRAVQCCLSPLCSSGCPIKPHSLLPCSFLDCFLFS